MTEHQTNGTKESALGNSVTQINNICIVISSKRSLTMKVDEHTNKSVFDISDAAGSSKLTIIAGLILSLIFAQIENTLGTAIELISAYNLFMSKCMLYTFFVSYIQQHLDVVFELWSFCSCDKS